MTDRLRDLLFFVCFFGLPILADSLDRMWGAL